MATVLRFGRDQDHLSIAQQHLWGFIEDRQLLTVYTKTRTYQNMLLVKAPMSRTPQLGDAATFNLEFHQLRIVESKDVRVP